MAVTFATAFAASPATTVFSASGSADVDITGYSIGTGSNILLLLPWSGANFATVISDGFTATWDFGGSNPQALTFIDSQGVNNGANGHAVYGLLGPLSTGTRTLRLHAGIGTLAMLCFPIAYNGVLQTNLTAACANRVKSFAGAGVTNGGDTVTGGSSNDMIFACASTSNTVSVARQTQRVLNNTGNVGLNVEDAAGAASVDMFWDINASYATNSFRIVGAGAGGGGVARVVGGLLGD